MVLGLCIGFTLGMILTLFLVSLGQSAKSDDD